MTLTRLMLLSLVLLSSQAFADDIRIVGNREESIRLTHSAPQTNPSLYAQSTLKPITLLEFELSDRAQRAVYKRVEQSLQSIENGSQAVTASKHVQLGMNNVPVLDQGQHGTCVTFAVTAAIDAALKKGDYVSQLCLLQLGAYLENQGAGLSGWDGLWGDVALERINKYGIMNLKNQRSHGCGGAKEYPYRSTPHTDMSPEEYAQYSEDLSSKVMTWEYVFDTSRLASDDDMNKAVNDVKTALDSGDRVVFGVLLPRTDLGTMGAVGWHSFFSDTWVLTGEIAHELDSATNLPGHEMIITGYDDAAVAMDSSGHRHHGLFTLRNSWGAYVADWGNFYMSYDYFKSLAIEAQKIHRVV